MERLQLAQCVWCKTEVCCTLYRVEDGFQVPGGTWPYNKHTYRRLQLWVNLNGLGEGQFR